MLHLPNFYLQGITGISFHFILDYLTNKSLQYASKSACNCQCTTREKGKKPNKQKTAHVSRIGTFFSGELIHFIWLVWTLVIAYWETLCDTNIAFQHHRLHGFSSLNSKKKTKKQTKSKKTQKHHCVFDRELKRCSNIFSASCRISLRFKFVNFFFFLSLHL